jgi:uncharacterized protein HemY
MANEEQLIGQLIAEGQGCLDNEKWQEAADLFTEAEQLEKWRDLYGGQIYASLAYAFAQLGDTTKAKHFLSQHEEQFGEYGITEEDE